MVSSAKFDKIDPLNGLVGIPFDAFVVRPLLVCIYIYTYVYTHVYIYILDARERAKARSLLDPSDQCDAKAFSPPISELGIELGFRILTSETQLSPLSASANLCLSLPPLKSILD